MPIGRHQRHVVDNGTAWSKLLSGINFDTLRIVNLPSGRVAKVMAAAGLNLFEHGPEELFVHEC